MKKVKEPDKRDGWYEIIPAEAARLRALFKKNRPLTIRKVEQFSADMKAKRFVQNGEPIIFDEDGAPLDGQHRLRACELADTPFITYCVFGVGSGSKGVFDTIDTGRARSMSDRLILEGFKNGVAAASIVRAIIIHEKHKSLMANTQITNAEAWSFVRSHEAEVVATLDVCRPAIKQLVGAVKGQALGFVHYHAAKRDRAKADRFVELLASGEGLSKNNPILQARNQVLLVAQRKETLPVYAQAALLIKAWNLFAKGASVKMLAWKRIEGFPEFE